MSQTDLGLEDVIVGRLLDGATACLQARDQEAFFQALEELVRRVRHAAFLCPPELATEVLERAMARTSARPRVRRVLELALTPLYDKPRLPVPGALSSSPDDEPDMPDTPGEFLWLFCVPVRVQFDPAQLARPFSLDPELLDAQVLIELLYESGYLGPDTALRAYTGLWQREELFTLGPRAWAQAFVTSELFNADAPPAAPVQTELALNQSLQFNLMLAARMPEGTRQLLNPEALEARFISALSGEIADQLARHGVRVQSVQAYAPAPLAVNFLLTSDAYQDSVRATLELARKEGAVQAFLRYPSEDYAELVVCDEEGEETLAMPATLAIEPRVEVARAFSLSAKAVGLSWKGCFSSVHGRGAQHTLH